MDTTQLNDLLRSILPKSKSRVNFLGVFPSDKIPSPSYLISHTPCCYVANVDPAGAPGSHWIAVYSSSPRNLEFFDSYASHPHDLGFHFPLNVQVVHNTKPIQSFTSSVCGQYCAYFLIHRSNGLPMHTIVRTLSKMSPSLSDSFVSKFIHKLKHTNGIK